MPEQKKFTSVAIDGANFGRFLDPDNRVSHGPENSFGRTQKISDQEAAKAYEEAWAGRYDAIRSQIGRDVLSTSNE